MAIIFTNAQVILATASSSGAVWSSTNDVSAHVRRVRINNGYDMHDITTMGMSAHARQAGLLDWSVETQMLQDLNDLEGLIETLQGITSSGRAFEIAVGFGASTAPTIPSTANRFFRGDVVLETHTPMDGAVGDALETPLRFMSVGNLVVVSSSGG